MIELIKDSLPEAIGGLTVAIVLGIIAWIKRKKIKYIFRRKKKRNENWTYFFGYIYFLIDGTETILCKLDNNKWRFPIETIENQVNSYEEVVNKIMSEFISKNGEFKNSFVQSSFSNAEIYPIETLKNKIEIIMDNKSFKVNPVFFKVKIDKKINLKTKDYFWNIKYKLFENSLSTFKCSIPEALRSINLIKVKNEFGFKVVEGVDILLFQEREDREERKKYYFLMLERDNPIEKRGGYEYPKGGIFYHETLFEAALRELTAETGIDQMNLFQYCGLLGHQTSDVSWRENPEYNTVRVHGVMFKFLGNDSEIKIDPKRKGHKSFNWMQYEDAHEAIWIGDYGKEFFNRWYSKRWEIFRDSTHPASVVIQLTEKCPYTCLFCLRRVKDEVELPFEELKLLVDILSFRKIKRITFTGGEPLEIGKKKLFKLIKYANSKKIHTSLSSTCINITEKDMLELNEYLDHILIPIHCIDEKYAESLFEKKNDGKNMFKKTKKVKEQEKKQKSY